MTEPRTVLPPAVVELDQEDDDAWGVPPGPLCSVCEHVMCPMCPAPSCDTLREDELPDQSMLCCDGSCSVDPIEFADWKDRALDLMLRRDHRCGTPIEEHTCWCVELGPYCPTWRRLPRRCGTCVARLRDEAPGASYIATGASGLQWYECPAHDELDNLAEDRRIRRELLSTWFERLYAARSVPLAELKTAQANVVVDLALCEPLPGPDDPRMQFVAQFWGTPPKGEQ